MPPSNRASASPESPKGTVPRDGAQCGTGTTANAPSSTPNVSRNVRSIAISGSIDRIISAKTVSTFT